MESNVAGAGRKSVSTSGAVFAIGIGLFVLVTTLAALPSTAGRPQWAWPMIGLCAAMPFAVATDPQWLRLIVAAFAVVFAARVWERTHGRAKHATASLAAFAVWWLVPAEARFPTDADEARANRKAGRRRLVRMFGKAVLVVGLVFINRATADITANPFLFAAWSMALVYAFISGIADAVTGTVMQTGVRASEAFDAPLLARSPREFWGERWNLFVTRWAFRNVFIPFGGRRSPAPATLGVFVISGLMHEYLIVACGNGFGERTGHTLVFFVLQGAAVLLLGRRKPILPRGLAVTLNLVFLIVTTPLFFRPLDAAVGYSRWWKPDRATQADGGCEMSRPRSVAMR